MTGRPACMIGRPGTVGDVGKIADCAYLTRTMTEPWLEQADDDDRHPV